MQMLTPDARQRLDRYLLVMHQSLRGRASEAAEVEADVRGRIAMALKAKKRQWRAQRWSTCSNGSTAGSPGAGRRATAVEARRTSGLVRGPRTGGWPSLLRAVRPLLATAPISRVVVGVAATSWPAPPTPSPASGHTSRGAQVADPPALVLISSAIGLLSWPAPKPAGRLGHRRESLPAPGRRRSRAVVAGEREPSRAIVAGDLVAARRIGNRGSPPPRRTARSVLPLAGTAWSAGACVQVRRRSARCSPAARTRHARIAPCGTREETASSLAVGQRARGLGCCAGIEPGEPADDHCWLHRSGTARSHHWPSQRTEERSYRP